MDNDDELFSQFKFPESGMVWGHLRRAGEI